MHAFGSHFTLPWEDVRDVGDGHLEGHRMFAVWGDLREADGHVSRSIRAMSPKRGSRLPAVTLPGAHFDVGPDAVLEVAERWSQTRSARWSTGDAGAPSESRAE